MRINLGAGGQRAAGWVHIDRAGDVDLIHDLTDPLPFDDGTVEAAVAHHVLDLLRLQDLIDLLGEVRRVLVLGAVFRISLANLDEAAQRAIHRDLDWFPEPRATLEQTVGWFITQGGARRTYLDAGRLMRLCTDVGFAHVFPSQYGHTMGPAYITDLDGRVGESLYAEAIR